MDVNTSLVKSSDHCLFWSLRGLAISKRASVRLPVSEHPCECISSAGRAQMAQASDKSVDEVQPRDSVRSPSFKALSFKSKISTTQDIREGGGNLLNGQWWPLWTCASGRLHAPTLSVSAGPCLRVQGRFQLCSQLVLSVSAKGLLNGHYRRVRRETERMRAGSTINRHKNTIWPRTPW